MMNKSAKWCVRHEPHIALGKSVLVIDPAMVAKRFARPFYGEVNGLLRHVLMYLPVQQRGVILRDPRDILLSAYNKRTFKMVHVDLIALGYRALDDALRTDSVIAIRFERMTTSVRYLQWVLKAFGIEDVTPTQADLAKKINTSGRSRAARYENIASSVRRRYEAQTNWYREKYYGSSQAAR